MALNTDWLPTAKNSAVPQLAMSCVNQTVEKRFYDSLPRKNIVN